MYTLNNMKTYLVLKSLLKLSNFPTFRGCLYENRDGIKNETGRFLSSLYM